MKILTDFGKTVETGMDPQLGRKEIHFAPPPAPYSLHSFAVSFPSHVSTNDKCLPHRLFTC